MKRLDKVPQDVIICTWIVVEDEGLYHWEGYCEGDKEKMSLNAGEALELLPHHFLGGRRIVEYLSVCPLCGMEVFVDEEGWYCPSCE